MFAKDFSGKKSALEPKINTELLRNFYKLQIPRFNLFKAQDPKTGHFDVIFDFNGKLLYANKYVLVTSSETLNAWLSDRWTTNNDPIKIETYSFEIFYQLCCFLYSGRCSLTAQNIFQIIDAAEFFGIQLLKKFCEDFMLEKKYSLIRGNGIFKVAEFAENYSLLKLKESVEFQIFLNFSAFINDSNFINFKKFDVILLCKCQNGPDYLSVFLGALYKWSEHQAKIKSSNQNDEKFNFKEAVKNEFNAFLPFLKVWGGNFSIFYDFMCNHIFLISVSDLFNIYSTYDYEIEKFFTLAFKIAENKMKNNTSNNETVKALIKSELDQFLPKIVSSHLSFNFVFEFLVERSFLFSAKEMLKILAECHRNKNAQEEQIFKIMYEIAEKEVLRKQEKQPVKNFDLTEAIKTELAEFLPKIKFHLMEKKFLMEFVVAKNILTHEQAFDKDIIKVEITNVDKTLTAIFKDTFGIADRIGRHKTKYFAYERMKQLFIDLKFILPSTPSPISKACYNEWYLYLDGNGILAAKGKLSIIETDYLIAELRSVNRFYGFNECSMSSLCVSRLYP